ncbi:MAG: diacylglycerol kinase family lipid kinase [Calditrichaeota bacterium]|nr:diacylglycerol kinase family lipid kinase [Calditrichota bacterium]
MHTCFIVNPVSAGGSTGKKWPEIEALLKKNYAFEFEVVFTQSPLHATRLTREALRRGTERIVGIGGDGTLNEIVNGFFEGDGLINPEAVLGVLEIGTGADFIKTLGQQPTVGQAILHLNEARSQTIDVGKAEFLTPENKTETRYFLNILDFGLGGAVVERVNRTTKRFGGKISFLVGILSTLLTFKNKHIRYRLDDGNWQSGMFNDIVVANGRYFGGGLFPAPEALLDDGLFDVVFLGDVGRLEAVLNLSKLRKGTHFENPKVSLTRARRIEAQSEETVFVDMDGELVGTLPLKVLILPQKLRILI